MRDFKLRITTPDGQHISFGKRKLGDIGKDIIAVKMALGAVVSVDDIPNARESLEEIDPNGWLDCITGEELTPRQLATFDKTMQIKLMKFQLDHQFLIMNYQFQKFGISDIINQSTTKLGYHPRSIGDTMQTIFDESNRSQRVEYDDLSDGGKRQLTEEIALDVHDSMTTAFSNALGILDESTLAILHGWLPHSRYGNESYHHLRPSEASESVIDIIPISMFRSYIGGNLTQTIGSLVSQDTIDGPNLDIETGAYINNADDLRSFNASAEERLKWSPEIGFEYASIKYKFKSKLDELENPRPSRLYTETINTLNQLKRIESAASVPWAQEIKELSTEGVKKAIERAVQPDHKTDPDPFIIDSNRIGFFYQASMPTGTPGIPGELFTIENIRNWVSIMDPEDNPETINHLEDQALREVLKFYGKPDVWYIFKESLEMQEQYFKIGDSDMPSPSHSSRWPHNRVSDDRSKYWVLTTNAAKNDSIIAIQENVAQTWDEIESNNLEEPLIKFIEYRRPSLRHGDPYRGYFEINRKKLDLITDGYYIKREESPPAPRSLNPDLEQMNRLSEHLSTVCEESDPDADDRRYREYRALAAKNRREIVRRIREQALQAHQSASINRSVDADLGHIPGTLLESWGVNLGPFGTLDLSDGRYAQVVGNALAGGANWLFDNTDEAINEAISAGEKTKQFTKEDRLDLLNLEINWSDLVNRLDIVKKDLNEAKKHAQQEQFTFEPEAFDPAKEAGNLSKIVTRIRILIEQAYSSTGSKWNGFDSSQAFTSAIPIASALIGSEDTSLHIEFDFDTVKNGPRIGMTTARIKKISTKKKIYVDNSKEDPESVPKEFSKGIAVGYLCQILEMTRGLAGQPEPQVVKNPAGCAEFGEVKNGVAYLIRYTFGLKATLPPNRKKDESSWYSRWWESGFEKPVMDWMAESAKNNRDIMDPKHFGEDEVLAAIGEQCTWPQLWKEFIDKVSPAMLLCDYLKCIGLPGITIKAPNLNIPPFPKIKIFGWYAGLVKMLKDKWREIIQRLICTVVRMLIDLLSLPLCDENYRDAFGNALNEAPLMQRALADALFGLPLEPGDEEKAKDFIEDALRALRGDEICRLLQGETIDSSAMALLERLAERHNLNTSFSDRDDILEFFNVIAGFVPSGLCERLEGLDDIIGEATCKDSVDLLRNLRDRFDANDEVSTEEISRALEQARQNLMDEATAMQLFLNNGLAPLVPDYINLGSPDALFSELPETINKSIERTSKHTFERTKMSYISTLSSFVPGLSVPTAKLPKAGDPGFNAEAVIKVEAAMQNLLDFQALSTAPDPQKPDNMNWRFLALYQIFEAEKINGHKVHTRYSTSDSIYQPKGEITFGTKISYDAYKNMEPADETTGDTTTRLRVVSYSKNIHAIVRGESYTDIDSGEEVPVDGMEDLLGFEYNATTAGPVTRPHPGVPANPGLTGPFAKHCVENPQEGSKLSRCPDNPDFIPNNDDLREMHGLLDEDGNSKNVYKCWENLHNMWVDDHLPAWGQFRRLDSNQAKEMFMLQRVQELTNIIQDNVPSATETETNSMYMTILKDLYDSSIESALEGTSDEQIDGITDVKMRMQTDELGPFKPSVVLEEFESVGSRDSYKITVKDNFLFPATPSGQVFDYCVPISASFITTPEGATLNPDSGNKTLAKRIVFGQQVLHMVGRDMERYDFSGFGTPAVHSNLLFPLHGDKQYTNSENNPYGTGAGADIINSVLGFNSSVYNLAFEGILEQVFFKLKNSRMFDEDYSREVHDRLTGKYKLQSGCTINKFSLNHFGILSFDKMLTDEIPDLVRAEMMRPENQPQNLDYEQPGPIEKGIQQATLKGFVRFCLIELMLKGAIPFAVWDIEGVRGDSFYTDYCIRYIHTQLNKYISIKEFWGPVAEKIAGITGPAHALKKIVEDEMHIMPSLSKQIFANNDASYNYIDFLTSNTNNIIPNRNIPSSFRQLAADEGLPGYDPGLLRWVSDEVVSKNPFLSIEHYIKIDGPIGHLSAITPDPNEAAAAVVATFDSLTRPADDDDGQLISEIIEGLNPFSNMLETIREISIDEEINPIPPSMSPIMLDSRDQAEIYHINEVRDMMQIISDASAGFDKVLGPAFGFVHRPARGLFPQVLQRAPSRFIRRQRKIFNLSSNEAFDPRSEIVKDLIRLKSSDISELINFRDINNVGIIENLASQLPGRQAVTQEADRFYIIPANLVDYKEQQVSQAIGIPEYSFNRFNGDLLEDWSSRFYRGWTLQNYDKTGKDPLDPTAWWLLDRTTNPDETGYGFDTVSRTLESEVEEILFRNVYGQVDQETFNDYRSKINDPVWVWGPTASENLDFPEMAVEEKWIETVIDFTGNASTIFSTPGESMDQAVEFWTHFGFTESMDAYLQLAEYFEDPLLEKITEGRSGNPSTDLAFSGQRRTQNELRLAKIGPARGMGYNRPSVSEEEEDLTIGSNSFDPRGRTILDIITDFENRRGRFTSGKYGVITGFQDILNRSLRENDYKIPMRLLITQIHARGEINKVFAKFVLPQTVSATRMDRTSTYEHGSNIPQRDLAKISDRVRRLDQALARVFREYLTMIELAYEQVPVSERLFSTEDEDHWVEDQGNAMSLDEARRMMDDPIGYAIERANQNAAEQEREDKIYKYRTVFNHYKDFPFLVGNFYEELSEGPVDMSDVLEENRPIEGSADKRAKFCSVSKIYSLACEAEADEPNSVFSTSQEKLDELFSSRGYLMKDNQVELRESSFPSYYKTVLRDWHLGGDGALNQLAWKEQLIKNALTRLRVESTPAGQLVDPSAFTPLSAVAGTLVYLPENLKGMRHAVTDKSRLEEEGDWEKWNEAYDAYSNLGVRSVTSGSHNRRTRLFFGYIDSMIRLFSGQTNIVADAEEVTRSNVSLEEAALPGPSRNCQIIDSLLRNAFPAANTFDERMRHVPEPFRSRLSAGCFDYSGQWRTEGDLSYENMFRGNRNLPEDISRSRPVRSNLSDKEYRDFAIFCIKLVLFAGNHAKMVALDEIFEYGDRTWAPIQNPNSNNNENDVYGMALQNSVSQAGTSGRGWTSMQFNYDVLSTVHNLLFIEREKMLDKIEKTEEHGTDFLLDQQTDLKEKKNHALALKADQRTGLNYLYRYDLHNFIQSGGLSFLTNSQNNIERCNKIALSISNMISWFSQKRSESFYGLTSRHGSIHPCDYPDARSSGYVPLRDGIRETVERTGNTGALVYTNNVPISFHTETPGVMCGFSPFVGDGRYNLEEFLEAYKQHFLGINPQADGKLRATAPEAPNNSTKSNAHWAPKIAYSYFVNSFISRLIDTHFDEDNLKGNPNSYRDFKYLKTTDQNNSGFGMFHAPQDKYDNLRYMLKVYREETKDYANVMSMGAYDSSNDDLGPSSNLEDITYAGHGVLGTNFFVNSVLTPTQGHLLEENNLASLYTSGYPMIKRDQKVFLFHPHHNSGYKDHFATVLEDILNRDRRGTGWMQVVRGNQIFAPMSDIGSYYYDAFAKEKVLSETELFSYQTMAIKAMIQRHWQCLLEDTGLFYFFENYKRIYAEALFESAATLLSHEGSSVKDCCRLVLNIPSPGASVSALHPLINSENSNFNPANSFVETHPMHSWLSAFHEHCANTNNPNAILTLSSEERAYLLSTTDGNSLFSFPLAKFEDGEDFALLESGGNIEAMYERFQANKYQRTRSLFEKEDAKRIIEYIFPFQRYMSLATVYSTSLLGGYNEIPNLMTSVKSGLAIIMYLSSVNSRSRLDFLEDVNQSEFLKKAMDNMVGLGNSKTGCFDFPFNDDLWDQLKEQLETLVKQMPAIILRGIADVIDPAYKEMKVHWQNCDIKHLRNSGWVANASMNDEKLLSGLQASKDRSWLQGRSAANDDEDPKYDEGDGVYVPILPAMPVDLAAGFMLLALSPAIGWIPGGNELRNSMLRMVSYIYKGPASLIDPTYAFKIPCLDIDEDFKKKWNHGKYGRYGHPLTPFTLFALMTAEINAERVEKAEACAELENGPAPACEDEE